MIKQINIKEIDDKIEDITSQIRFVKKWIQDSNTAAKQEYLKELQLEVVELIHFKGLVEKYEQPIPVETKPSVTTIEVKVVARYRDGGSDDVVDKEGNKYHIPISYKMYKSNSGNNLWGSSYERPYYGHYVSKIHNKTYVPDSVEFKEVKEFSNV